MNIQIDALKSFARDTANHTMKILKDDGLYRHLNFSKNGAYCGSFDLITWPGFLMIAGDYGDYCFSRIPDMFDFFCSGNGDDTNNFGINPSYWGEKLQAQGREGYREFSLEKFRENIFDYIKSWIACHLNEDDELDDDDAEKLDSIVYEVYESIYCENFSDGQTAYNAVHDFELDDFDFMYFWERNNEDYTFHYIWCLYAIVWGISQYKAMKPVDDGVKEE